MAILTTVSLKRAIPMAEESTNGPRAGYTTASGKRATFMAEESTKGQMAPLTTASIKRASDTAEEFLKIVMVLTIRGSSLEVYKEDLEPITPKRDP